MYAYQAEQVRIIGILIVRSKLIERGTLTLQNDLSAMPSYFSDIRPVDSPSLDDEGAEFADNAAVKLEARLSVLELARDRLGNEPDAMSVDVRDDSVAAFLAFRCQFRWSGAIYACICSTEVFARFAGGQETR